MTRKSGLGRGLDALLPGPGSESPQARGGLDEVPIDAIRPNRRQPRRSFDDAALTELAASIAQLGLLQPVLVRRAPDAGPGHYELVAGERRWRAARTAGLERVPVLEISTDERGALERALVENIHRADLNPIEEAAAYRQLMDEGGLTQEQLGERLARSRPTVANTMRLLDLPAPIQKLLIDGRLTAGHGRALLGLGGNPFQERLAHRIAFEGISVRATEDLVRRYQSLVPAMSARPGAPLERHPVVTEAQSALAGHLRARVKVEMGKRKGRITIDFASLEELDRLLELIVGDHREATRVVSPSSPEDAS